MLVSMRPWGERAVLMALYAGLLLLVILAKGFTPDYNQILIRVGAVAVLGTACHPIAVRAWPSRYDSLGWIHCFNGFFLYGVMIVYVFENFSVIDDAGVVEVFAGVFVFILVFTGVILRLLPWAGELRYLARSTHTPIARIFFLLIAYRLLSLLGIL